MKNDITFTLTAFEASKLLKELEYGMQFYNRDVRDAYMLWYQLAGQLNGATYEEATAHAREKAKVAKLKEAEKAEKDMKVQQVTEAKLSLWSRFVLGKF